MNAGNCQEPPSQPSPQKNARLRVVVFTAGPLRPINRVFFERLAGDPQIELRALIIDEYRRPRKPLWKKIHRGLQREGLSWLIYRLAKSFRSLGRRISSRLFDLLHSRTQSDESYEAFARRIRIPIYRVDDIHRDSSLTLIGSLQPQLGVILGGRILKDKVITLPSMGTVNVHKRKVPDYRGGGPVGYWEILDNQPCIGVTIHYATAKVDAGPILAETTIPIDECDTLESLQIKADIVGANLYCEAIRSIARGEARSKPQDTSRGKTYRAPSELQVHLLEKRLRRKMRRTMPLLRQRRLFFTQLRVFLQYVFVLPWLLILRRWFIHRGRAPIWMLYYHVVANRPANHMCLPLETFVRQIEMIQRYCKVLSIEEAVEKLRSGQNSEVATVLTFDDGYHDNFWAIEYLRYFSIPACFFLAIGHVQDGTPFAHDLEGGYQSAYPLSESEVRELAAHGFSIGSHGMYHEDFGQIAPDAADRTLQESMQKIQAICGRAPEHFSFPIGHKVNISRDSFLTAQKHYRYVYSAYGGYNFPERDRRHFLRFPNPNDTLELMSIMDGYTVMRNILRGDAWGKRSFAYPPYLEVASSLSRDPHRK